MVLDGVIQITEADEFVYQEMLAHVPLLAHGAAENVLIIGAGDGGVLRRVLQHDTVRRAVMVEIDSEVIRLAKEFLPGIAGDAWTDERAQVIVGDGIEYVQRAPDGSFDVIIVNSTDPIGVGEVLFTDTFYHNCARILTAARPDREPVRRAVHAGRRTARDQRAAPEILPPCHRLCRRRADLCRRLHDAGVGGERRIAGGDPGGNDPRARQPGRHPGHDASTGLPKSTPAHSICRPISRVTSRRCRFISNLPSSCRVGM